MLRVGHFQAEFANKSQRAFYSYVENYTYTLEYMRK